MLEIIYVIVVCGIILSIILISKSAEKRTVYNLNDIDNNDCKINLENSRFDF